MLQDLAGGGVEHLDRVVVAGADIEQRAVGVQRDAARALSNLDGLRDLQRLGVDHAQRIVFLVGDEHGLARRRSRKRHDDDRRRQQHPLHHIGVSPLNVAV